MTKLALAILAAFVVAALTLANVAGAAVESLFPLTAIMGAL